MANNDNAHPSSEDELFVSTATEPMAYTFQSDLSEDEIKIATAQPAPKPISPAASVADRSRAFSDSDAAIPDPQRLIPSPAVAEDDDPALFLEQAAAALAAVTKADTSTKPKKRESESLASWRGSVNALTNGVSDHNIAGTRRVDIEVALPWLPPSKRAAFTYVEVEDSDEGTKHYDTRRRRNKKLSSLHYRDHILIVEYSTNPSSSLPRYELRSRYCFAAQEAPAYDDYRFDDELEGLGLRKRKRRYEDDEELYEENSGDDYGGRHSLHDYGFVNGAKRSTRTSARASSERSIAYESGTESRALRPRSAKKYRDYDRDELQNSDDDDGFFVVTSDIVKTRGRKKRKSTAKLKTTMGDGDSDIEFESKRRSSRANKSKKSMKEIFDDDDDDDIFYVQDTKPTAPRIASVREVFKPAPVDFKDAHRPKKTPKQEEKLREENDGVDPIMPVDPKLVNNPLNVLFRCSKCHRGWHYEHLPHPNDTRDPAISDPLNLRNHRLQEYQTTWRCKECIDTEDLKIDKVVAWRPTHIKPSQYVRGQTILNFNEDEIEYLVKWENKSYAHCVWMPGPWIYGVSKGNMRLSFIKRALGEGMEDQASRDEPADALLKWTEKDAIHDSWLTPDIILDVQYAAKSIEDTKKYKAMSLADRMEYDLSRIFHVVKIFVKFEGLGYDDAVWDTPPPADSSMYDAYLEAYREYLNGKHFKSEPWRNQKERIEAFRQMEFNGAIEVKKQPPGLTRGKLMTYQLEGLNWMLYNFRHDRSVILADEMGLGKTVQVVALLSSMIQDNPKIWPFLIVVPNATCANWRREIKKWAPDLRVVAYYGGRVSQTLALQYELFPNGTKDMKAHVVIMSYDSIKDTDTRSRFNSVKWAGLIVDEAQALKNDENSLYKALSVMNIPFKLLLTGTPLQNNKRELFNLLQFIDPKLKAEELDEEFKDITKENLPKLHELIRPYFLRRTKAMVLTFLPPMAQIILPVSMTVLQEKLCKSIMERNPQLIRAIFSANGKLKSQDRGSLSNILMQLRKCLCHPFVYSQSIEDRNLSPEVTKRNLIEASSKLLLLEVMLPKLRERGHRVLIFSQFLDQLTILEDFLAGMDLPYQRLDGSQSSMEKQKRIDAFNAPDSQLFCMLLSTRAGGVGINLATADTVIILDPDWNPHQDIQALSRAHRIGQQKKVLCFQLMTVDSAEEKILQIGRKKMALDHLLIETMDDKEGEAANDVETVLKHGAAALFGEGRKKDRIVYDEAAIDKLLDRSAKEETKQDGDKSAESAFAFARVWAQDEGGLKDDVETEQKALTMSVWDQILQQREEEARLEREKELQALGRGGRRRGTANYRGPKFEFEEGQEGGESDRGDQDGDFMGGDDSDGETSGNENGNSPHGEFLPNGGSSRKSQARNAQQADAQDSSDPRHPQQTRSRQGSQNQLVVQIAPAPGPAAPNPKGRPTKPVRPSSHNQEVHRIADFNTPHGQIPASGGLAMPSHAIGGDLAVHPRPVPSTHRPNGNPNGASKLTSNTPILVPRPGAGVVTGARIRPPSLNGLPNLNPNRQPNNLPSDVTKQPKPGILWSNQGPPVPPGVPHTSCFVCGFVHPPTWMCPEMSQEVPLRLALDNLRLIPHQTPERMEIKRKFLLEMLRVVQQRKEEAMRAKQRQQSGQQTQEGQQSQQGQQGQQRQEGQEPPQVPPS
uniref:Related to helicase-DNA-binding protein n=1 Tax=Neurospora crassa TaxID=5141 RepID=Q6MW11_NEUCS|nr:related to helicase-DNA-binding protein [Neurospora crassa]